MANNRHIEPIIAQQALSKTSLVASKTSHHSFEKHIGERMEKSSMDRFVLDSYSQSMTAVEVQISVSWSQSSLKHKITHVIKVVFKIISALILLYLFICSLDLISVGFRIVGGAEPQKLLRVEVAILNNYVVGLMVGILFTIVVQSSSTTTSVVVGLVAGKIIPIRSAIPIIMGANIGTSVTNTLLAMTQVADRNKFRRSFAAATVHDMFNWLTALVLLPIESLTGYLYYTSHFMIQEITIAENSNNSFKVEFLKAITDPLTKRIVKLDKKVIDGWNSPDKLIHYKYRSCIEEKGHLFAGLKWGDKAIGGVVIAISFVSLLVCLLLLVKCLKSLLKGRIAVWIHHTSNANLPHCPKMTDYLLMLMGALLTFFMQSSSAFTSTLPPLVSVKALSLERAYTLTLGSNIGTTTTAILAALAQSEGRNFSLALQIALCHLFFNLTGVLLFYPLPCTRFPIRMAKSLGNTTAKYRWFAIVYILGLFVLLPLLFMGLAFAGRTCVFIVAMLLVLTFLFIVFINSLRKYPRCLPKFFHNWNWLPEGLRSLEPYDRLFTKCACCHKLVKLANTQQHPVPIKEKTSLKLGESK